MPGRMRLFSLTRLVRIGTLSARPLSFRMTIARVLACLSHRPSPWVPQPRSWQQSPGAGANWLPERPQQHASNQDMTKPIVLVTEGSDAKPLDWLREQARVCECPYDDPAIDKHLAQAQ